MMEWGEMSLCVCCQRVCWRLGDSLRECTGWQHRLSWVSEQGCGHRKKWGARRVTRWEAVVRQDFWARVEDNVRRRRHWAREKPGPTFTERSTAYGRCCGWNCFVFCRHCDDARAWRIIRQEGGCGRAERRPKGKSEGKEQRASLLTGERIGQA